MVTVIESDLVIENAQLKQRVAELEAALAMLTSCDIVMYCGKVYERVNRAPEYNDIVLFENPTTTLIKEKEFYRINFWNGKPRFVLENSMIVGLYDQAVQRSVSGMKVYTPMKEGE